MVTFDDADLGMFNAEKKKLIKEDDAVEISKQTEGASKKTDEQEQLLKSLFVTQEDEAMDEFEQKKDVEVENQVGKSVAKKTLMQGWGTWAGDGVDNSQME